MSHKKLFTKVMRAYPPGAVIFNEGDAWNGLYCVQTGRVAVFKNLRTTEGNNRLELAQLGPGSLIGEMGLFDKDKREATVQALEYTEMLVISREMFDEQMAKVPPWMVNLFQLLTHRLRMTNERLVAANKAESTPPPSEVRAQGNPPAAT